ncbi:hypothetical protein [Belnapia moabensis]|uniref:hypothetical protein n=1 Tax=Belnapia moabensis TaxID=365533 RepID=UPI0012ECFC77|nr:hypothetical protein [Belnapia moabensis]
MTIFLLQPTSEGIPDPAWALSWHVGACEIAADSPEMARNLAAGQFTVPVLPGLHLACHRSPWFEQKLVVVTALDDAVAKDRD